MFENLDFYKANENDLSSIFKIIDITGWGETARDIELVLKNPNNKYITVVNRITGEMIGITLVVSYGIVGFIGHVVVLPEYRDMGIGEELMVEAINYLKFKGCKTIKLDAVDKAKSLYERVGFKFEVNSLRFQYETANSSSLNNLIEKLLSFEQKFPIFNVKENELADISNKDKEFFGANRSAFLTALYNEYSKFVFIIKDANNSILGYSFSSYQNGVLKIRAGVGDSINTIVNLIKATILTFKDDNKLKFIKIGIPENSRFGIKILEELGFIKTSFSLRMYWGEKSSSTTHPLIFAIGDPAKG